MEYETILRTGLLLLKDRQREAVLKRVNSSFTQVTSGVTRGMDNTNTTWLNVVMLIGSLMRL